MTLNQWKRRGWWYVAKIKHDPPLRRGEFFVTLTIRRYGFFSFWFIKLIHGKEPSLECK